MLATAEILKAGLRPHRGEGPVDYRIVVLTADELRSHLDEIITDPEISPDEKQTLTKPPDGVDENGHFCFNRTVWDANDPNDRPVSFSFAPATASPAKIARCIEVAIKLTAGPANVIEDNRS